MQITVFSKNKCVQCNGTYYALNNLKLDYTVVNAEENEDAAKFVIGTLGLRTMPVVLVHEGDWSDFKPTDENVGDFWGGHRPDRLKALRERIMEPVGASA